MTAPRAPIQTVEDLRGRRTTVLGLARSGVAACRFLADAGAVVVAYDRRPASELVAEVASLGARPVRLALGVDEASAVALLAHADLLVTSPSISPSFPTTDRWLRDALIAAEARGAELVSEVDLFLRLTRARILGVTGTKGKTTTASLVAAMLARGGVPSVLGGNIGTPLIERATELSPDDWAILELSELQLPTISRGADVALYTNIGEDHLDRHGTVAAYQAVKARLAELSAPGGRVVLNNDDAGCRALGDRLSPASVAWYGREEPARGRIEAWLDEEGWVRVAGERLLPARDVRLPGRHMLSNVIGASLAATLVGVPAHAIGEAIAAFEGVPHRLEYNALFYWFGSVLLEMDCDFSHDPADVPRLLAAVADGADLALGSRYVPGGGTGNWGLVRRLISRGGSLYAQILLPETHVRDLTGGFKAFRRPVLETIDLDAIHSRGYAFQIENTYRTLRKGFRVVEVPIRFVDREQGGSKMSRAMVPRGDLEGAADPARGAGGAAVTLEEFDAALAAVGGLAVVDFWAPWCKPCEAIEPILVALPLPVVRVNLDDSPDVGGRFGVLSLPTVLLIEEGQAKAEVLGAQPRERFERAFAAWL